jgi:hypothetical protein
MGELTRMMELDMDWSSLRLNLNYFPLSVMTLTLSTMRAPLQLGR